MMKRARKLAALLLALVMALTLAACGGKGGSKTNPAVGKYMGEAVLSFDEWIPMEDVYDLGDNYIELKEDGTGCFMLDAGEVWRPDAGQRRIGLQLHAEGRPDYGERLLRL